MADYDVIVIGCGPAGQKAAIKCTKVGRRTAIVDERQVVGGQCLHIGTIPSKTLRAAIIYLSGYYERRIYGADYKVKADLVASDLIYRCHAVMRREIDVIHDQLSRNRVDVLTGEGRFLDPYTIRVTDIVGTMDYTADYIVICTGSAAEIKQDLPFDNVHIMNTDDILKLQYIPQRLLLIGGGVIGLEYASMFSLLVPEVHVVTRHAQLLPWVDRQLVSALMNHMQRQGVAFHLADQLQDVCLHADDHVTGRLASGAPLVGDMLMYAAPRKGNTASLNLAAAGLQADDRGLLTVNENYQTSQPHIYAAGDVIGYPSLASAAIDQGRKAANHLLGVPDVPYEPIFPYGIYTFPDMSMVGASEEALKADNKPYATGIGHYRDSARGQIIGDHDGLIKLLFDPGSRLLLGAHIIGYEATELIHLAQAALLSGAKIDYFIDTVFNYPTLAEVYKIAALNGFNQLEAARPLEHL